MVGDMTRSFSMERIPLHNTGTSRIPTVPQPESSEKSRKAFSFLSLRYPPSYHPIQVVVDRSAQIACDGENISHLTNHLTVDVVIQQVVHVNLNQGTLWHSKCVTTSPSSVTNLSIHRSVSFVLGFSKALA